MRVPWEIEQVPALVALALPGAVSLHGFRVRRPVLLPVSGMIAAPFAGALAANLAILRVRSQLLFTAVGAAPLLARWLGANRLLGMTSGGLELMVAITAAPVNHPYRVKAPAVAYRSEK